MGSNKKTQKLRKRDLQVLSEQKLNELKILHDSCYYDSVVSQSGLVVEFGLKASVCKTINENIYPESKKEYRVHESEKLIDLADLREELENEKVSNLDFFVSWSLLSKWSIDFRYMPIGSYNRNVSKSYIDALNGEIGGVHPWIKKHW